jgi:ribosomal protein S17E
MPNPLIFGIQSNTMPTGYTGTVVNSFTSDYTLEKNEKDFTGNPPVVVDTRLTSIKYKHVMNATAGFLTKPDAQGVIDLLNTSVTVTITSMDTVTESITGTLVKATHSGDKEGWWEVAMQVEAIMTQTA